MHRPHDLEAVNIFFLASVAALLSVFLVLCTHSCNLVYLARESEHPLSLNIFYSSTLVIFDGASRGAIEHQRQHRADC